MSKKSRQRSRRDRRRRDDLIAAEIAAQGDILTRRDDGLVHVRFEEAWSVNDLAQRLRHSEFFHATLMNQTALSRVRKAGSVPPEIYKLAAEELHAHLLKRGGVSTTSAPPDPPDSVTAADVADVPKVAKANDEVLKVSVPARGPFAVRTGFGLLHVMELLLPPRVAREDLGDQIERMHALRDRGARPSTLLFTAVCACFWLAINGIREAVSGLRGEKAQGAD